MVIPGKHRCLCSFPPQNASRNCSKGLDEIVHDCSCEHQPLFFLILLARPVRLEVTFIAIISLLYPGSALIFFVKNKLFKLFVSLVCKFKKLHVWYVCQLQCGRQVELHIATLLYVSSKAKGFRRIPGVHRCLCSFPPNNGFQKLQ